MATSTPGYLGPYRLLNVVHTGQSSQIWQAFHDGEDKVFGIKTLLEKSRKDKEQVGYLRWEQAVGQKISHPKIIQIYEFAVDRGIPYLSMEWFSAPNMKQLTQQGIATFAHLIPKIVDQAAEGLAAFNRLGWVHRDVKPDNFLVTQEGDVRLIDFALARRSDQGLRRLFARKARVQGTLSYMSPEQIRGVALDQRADVYAFGCVLYHLLAGSPPFTGTSVNELLNKHLKAQPPALEGVDRNIAPEFSQLIRRAMSKKPAERPESANEFRKSRVFKVPPRPPKDPLRNT